MLQSQKKPGQMPGDMTNLYVGNHIIEARYNYNLIQERIFNHIIWYCQQYIDLVKKGAPIVQLGLFSEFVSDNEIKVPIKMNHIGKPDIYDHIRESCRDMREITVETKVKDKQGITWKVWDGLINRIEEVEDKKRSNIIYAVISKSVAEMLISIQVRSKINDKGEPVMEPINFTTFRYEICMSSKNKYTARLYKIISGYKNRLFVKVSVDDLRIALGLGAKYKDSEALKRRILKPVMEELKEYGDIWYDIEDPEFENKEGKKVVGYKFTIIDAKHNVNYRTQKADLIYSFKATFGLKPYHIEKIQFIFDNPHHWKSLDWRMKIVLTEIQKGKKRDVPAYIVTSLLNHFKEG